MSNNTLVRYDQQLNVASLFVNNAKKDYFIMLNTSDSDYQCIENTLNILKNNGDLKENIIIDKNLIDKILPISKINRNYTGSRLVKIIIDMNGGDIKDLHENTSALC